MTDQVLDILKMVLLAMLYLFFARVLWAVWSEVRPPKAQPVPAEHSEARQPTGPSDDTTLAECPAAPVAAAAAGTAGPARKAPKAPKGRRGHVGRLAVIEPKAGRGVTFALGREVTIGRDPNCTITMPDDVYVSQMHAHVVPRNGEHVVEDLGSKNGTFLNGNRLDSPRPLHRGDRIQVGATVLEAQ
jgi:pSer/pThr/pTyr-binding forkhead associated (FHA) protein